MVKSAAGLFPMQSPKESSRQGARGSSQQQQGQRRIKKPQANSQA
jgi:hypothetical protein